MFHKDGKSGSQKADRNAVWHENGLGKGEAAVWDDVMKVFAFSCFKKQSPATNTFPFTYLADSIPMLYVTD